MAAGQRLRHQMRLVAGVELVAQIFDVPLDGSRSDSELQRALFRRKSARDALEHFALAVRQGDEIVLLPRKIHHQLPNWEST